MEDAWALRIRFCYERTAELQCRIASVPRLVAYEFKCIISAFGEIAGADLLNSAFILWVRVFMDAEVADAAHVGA